MADINKFTTKEVLNKVLLDSSGNAVEAFSHTTQEALNAALDTTNNRLNVSLSGGTISGDVTITGDLTVSPGSNTHAYDELINGMLEITDGTSAPTLRLTRGQSDNHVVIDGDADADDILGVLEFGAHDATYTGTSYQSGARIVAIADAAWDVDHVNDAATALHFYTQIDGTGNGYDTYPGSSAKMVISSAGNVGIGTASPSQLIHLKGSIPTILLEDSTNGNLAFIGDAQDFLTGSSPGADSFGIRSEGDIRLGTGGNNLRMVIDSNGRTGLGVPSPAQALAVQGSTYDNIGILSGTDVFGLITCQGSDLAIKASNSNAIQFHASGASRFKLDTNSRISLSNNDSGTQNTVFGYLAGDAGGNGIDAGSNYNVFIGHNVAGGATLNDATDNTGVGYSALANLTSGDDNVAVGKQSLLSLTTGTRNTAVGQGAGDGLTTANRTVIIGDSAGSGVMTTGGSIPSNADGTVAIGYAALYANTTGVANVAIGYKALEDNQTGAYNTAVGYTALSNTTNNYNTAVGYASLVTVVGGGGNTAMGHESLYHNSSASNNTGIGYQAGFYTTGADNTYLGYKAGFGASGAETNNVGIGGSALLSVTSGSYNTAVGTYAGDAITTSSNCTLIGRAAGSAINHTDANGTVCVGNDSGESITSAIGSTALGKGALGSNSTGDHNTAVGFEALNDCTAGLNVALGYQAADNLTSGTSNTVIGARAMGAADGGEQNNVIIGADAGDVINDDAADGNVIIGHDADPSGSAGTNQIVIGQGATGQADNSVTLGNSDVTAVYMAEDSGATVHADKYMSTTMPAFLVRPASNQLNIASGSHIAIPFGTEVFDQGSNFASNTFTAPVTGKYQLSVCLYLNSLDSASDYYEARIVTSNRNYFHVLDPDFGQDTVYYVLAISVLADMDASDTASITLIQNNGDAQTDVKTDSFFSGHLVC